VIVTFEKKYLLDLYEKGETSNKKHRFQPKIIRKYKVCITTLLSAENIEELFTISSFNYEVLQGNKKGISSIRVNRQYRIEFTVKNEGIEPVVTICNILELSNHYK